MAISNPYTYISMQAMEGRINWHLNDLCNLKCEYCFFPYFVKENPDVAKLSPAEILAAFNKTGRRWHIYLAGGEPMLYPDFNLLVNTLKAEHPLTISTNLYNKNVKAFARDVTPDNIVIINASLHIGQHTETSLQKFIENYHLLAEKGFNVLVSYVTYPPLFSRIEEDFKYLKAQGIQHIHPLTFQGMFEGRQYPQSYTREQLVVIERLSIDKLEMITALDKMNFKNKPCRAGKDYFFMDIQGEVTRCVTTMQPMGNLFNGTFKPNAAAVACPAVHCNDSCQGFVSLLEDPVVPTINSEFMYAVLKNYNSLKTIFTRNPTS